jgi:hypothetical protein
MTHTTDDLPERLSVVGASDLERRMLKAAAGEQPAPELRQRMAAAIGISGAVGATAAAAATGASKGAATSLALVPWISGGIVVLAVGGLIAMRSWAPSARPPSAPSTPRSAITAPAAAAPTPAPAAATTEVPGASAASASHADGASATDLRQQIALLDSVRAALASAAHARALDLLRRYQDRYPAGSFRPEAAALRIEALVRLGRTAEARGLADRFVAEHGASPLAERVARLVRETSR